MHLKTWIIVVFLNSIFCLKAQIVPDTSDMIFSGTKINPYNLEFDSTASITYSAYIDTYYANYTDSSNLNAFQKFPTISPRNNAFGLNMVQFGVKYESRNFRGTATLFWGDTPSSAWSPYLNFVQEANLGFKIHKKIWFDAGFFRTHIGLESIQPRENMTLSLATTTYFEPYFLSGAKLTWNCSKKLTVQLNAFNSFNQFIETNQNKTVGISLAYTPTESLNISLSSVLTDESASSFPVSQMRSYTNLYMIYKKQRFTLGFEFNYGYQEHAKLTDMTKAAWMFSSLLALKYRLTSKFATYVRGEMYSDPNEILTGPVVDANHTLVGLDIIGMTHGYEFKPIPNSYVRIEGRYLQTKKAEKIFYYDQSSRNFRYELLVGVGLWF